MTDRCTYNGSLTDSRRWDRVDLRAGDSVVVTPPKCGTTWMQTIVSLLLSGDPAAETDLAIRMPWIDIRYRDIDEVTARLTAQDGPRSMKSHTPLDGLPIVEGVQYLCVFRHPLDAHISFCNHVCNIPLDIFDALYPEDDPAQTFQNFLAGSADGEDCDAMPLAHILRHYTAAKTLAERDNVALFHYADMTRDLAGVFARVAKMLGITHSDTVMAELVAAATFDNMKAHATRFSPAGAGFFKSDSGFFHSGTCGQWDGLLTPEDLAAYDAVMGAHLSPEDRAWLEFGGTA